MTATADRIDRELAAKALEKRKSGQSPTTKELAALKRVEKQRDEDLRWEHYAAIPKKHWVQMSGRQVKVLNEQATRYGIPFDGRTVNLPAVVRKLHDFLAENAAVLAKRDEDPLLSGSDSPGLERYRTAKADLAELELERQRGTLVSLDRVRDRMAATFTLIRRAGERLQQHYGAAALQILNDALDDCKQLVDGDL